jgi:hypothetical protein
MRNAFFSQLYFTNAQQTVVALSNLCCGPRLCREIIVNFVLLPTGWKVGVQVPACGYILFGLFNESVLLHSTYRVQPSPQDAFFCRDTDSCLCVMPDNHLTPSRSLDAQGHGSYQGIVDLNEAPVRSMPAASWLGGRRRAARSNSASHSWVYVCVTYMLLAFALRLCSLIRVGSAPQVLLGQRNQIIFYYCSAACVRLISSSQASAYRQG